MKTFKATKAWMLVFCIVVTAGSATAAKIESSTPFTRDAALGPGGHLRGELVDSANRPQDEITVSVVYQGKVVARTKTDHDGKFSITGLRSREYLLTAHGSSSLWRLSQADTASPVAKTGVLLVSDGTAVRGKLAGLRSNPRIAVAAAVGVGFWSMN